MAERGGSETPATSVVLGVDAGGSKTAAALARCGADGSLQILGRGEAGPGNPLSADFDAAMRNIHGAVNQAVARASGTRRVPESACFAVAGVQTAALQGSVQRWALSRGIARRVLVVHDAEPVLACGADPPWGIALISGTGAMGYGKSRTGQSARCGGWGGPWGDEGSGFSIASQGLRAAAACLDQRAEDTSLVSMAFQWSDTSRADQLRRTLSARRTDRAWVASFAPMVCEAAESGDAVAQTIVDRAAEDLHLIVQSLAKQLQLPAERYPLCLAGSVLIRSDVVRCRLAERLQASGASPEFHIVRDPVEGALRLARSLI